MTADLLRPREDIVKMLMSGPGRFTGEYSSEDVAIAQAWPDIHGPEVWVRRAEGVSARTPMTLVFRVAPLDKRPGVMVPNYRPIGEWVCSSLALLYGKRFDFHGPTESMGGYHVPETRELYETRATGVRINDSSARTDFPVPLELGQIRRLQPILERPPSDQKRLDAFRTATAFYARALRSAERDPEVAYLHLITAGEIASNGYPFDGPPPLDCASATIIARARAEMKKGEKAARLIESRMRRIKSGYVRLFTSLVDNEFFSRSEASEKWDSLQSETFEDNIKAAYDLRSKYVHTGISFGRWVELGMGNAERQNGRPVVSDKEMAKILYLAPRLAGLERLTRYVLLKFAVVLGVDLSDLPTAPGPETASA